MKETLEQVLELETEFDQFAKEALRSNEPFQAIFIQATCIQATRLSAQTASEEKRRLLQNAILNSAILSAGQYFHVKVPAIEATAKIKLGR